MPCPSGWRSSRSEVPNPWVALAARPHLVLVRAPIDTPGRYYDDHRTIVLRSGLLLREERRYLWHELLHADRRDKACHNDAQSERVVERHAAENAMPWESVQWAWSKAVDLSEMAEMLKLPEDWVWFRLKHLHPAQKALLRVREAHAPC